MRGIDSGRRPSPGGVLGRSSIALPFAHPSGSLHALLWARKRSWIRRCLILAPATAGPGFWALFSGVVVLSLGGMLLMFFTASRLKDAVQNERWPQQSVDLWRSRTRSSRWRARVWLMLLFMFVAMVAGDRHRGFIHGSMFICWPFSVTLQTLGQLGAAFSKPASFRASGSSPI